MTGRGSGRRTASSNRTCPSRSRPRSCGGTDAGHAAAHVVGCAARRLASAGLLLLVAGCQTTPGAGGTPSSTGSPGGAGGTPLHEIVHRYVLGDPGLDECLEDSKGSAEEFVQIEFEAMPSGELQLLKLEGTRAPDVAACVRDALARIRLPTGSVAEPKAITVSIR